MAASTLILRDIHQPPPPGWWPLAPGWWMVLALIVAATATVLLWRRQRRRRLQRLAALFDDTVAAALSPPAQVAAISELLRRAARRHDPAAANLQGEAWLAFLDGEPVPSGTVVGTVPGETKPASTPLDTTPLNRAPSDGAPLHSTPFDSTPFDSTPFDSTSPYSTQISHPPPRDHRRPPIHLAHESTPKRDPIAPRASRTPQHRHLLPARPFRHGAGRLLLDGGYRPAVDPRQVAQLQVIARERFLHWMTR